MELPQHSDWPDNYFPVIFVLVLLPGLYFIFKALSKKNIDKDKED